MRLYRILDLVIIDWRTKDVKAFVADFIAKRRTGAVYFANAHTLNRAAEDPAYHAALGRALAIFGDGTGVRWAARLRGLRLYENLNGTDLVPAILNDVKGLRCFVVGSRPDRIEGILQTMRRRFPGVCFVGGHHGYLDEVASEDVVAAIRRSGANLVLVGMGNPLQETWIDRYGGRLPGVLSIGVGGLLEYWSGALTRAPAWMRRAGIEWFYLMVKQPWKARRYLVGNPLYLARVLMHASRDRAAFAIATGVPFLG